MDSITSCTIRFVQKQPTGWIQVTIKTQSHRPFSMFQPPPLTAVRTSERHRHVQTCNVTVTYAPCHSRIHCMIQTLCCTGMMVGIVISNFATASTPASWRAPAFFSQPPPAGILWLTHPASSVANVPQRADEPHQQGSVLQRSAECDLGEEAATGSGVVGALVRLPVVAAVRAALRRPPEKALPLRITLNDGSQLLRRPLVDGVPNCVSALAGARL